MSRQGMTGKSGRALLLSATAGLALMALAGAAWAADVAGVKSDPNNGVTDTTIKFGWMGDETNGGASVLLPVLHGLQAYADHINGKGGVLGRKVQIINLDDVFKPDNATINFRRLVNDDKVLAISAMGGSQISTPLAPAVNNAKIPVVFPAQTIDAQLAVPYFFNLIPHYADQADVIVAHAAKTVGGASKLKLVVIRLNVPSGEEFDQYVQRSLTAQGAQYAGNITTGVTQNDFTPTIVQLKQAIEGGANFIAIHGSEKTGLSVLTAMSKGGVKTPAAGINSMAAPNMFETGPADVMANFGAVQGVLPPTSGVPGAQEMLTYIKAHPSLAHDGMEPYFSEGWLTGLVMHQAAERAAKDNGGTLNRETFFKALKGKFDTGGLTCPLDFTGPMHYVPCAIFMTWDGKGLVAKDGVQAYTSALRKNYGLK